MRKVIHYLITILALGFAAYLVKWGDIFNLNLSFGGVVLVLFFSVLIHFLKFLRLYILLLEEHVTIISALKTYVKTTFVAVSYPFKTGEIFKAYTYGYVIKSYTKGLITLLIERFYDVLILCLILIPACFFFGDEKLSMIVYLMGVFIISIVILYALFEKTYKYLNKRLIVRGSNEEKNIYALKTIEKMHNVYLDAKNMIEGRQMILILLSIGAWAAEVGLLIAMGGVLGITVNIVEVGKYISDGFFGIENPLYMQYMGLSVIVLAAGVVIGLLLDFCKLILKRSKK